MGDKRFSVAIDGPSGAGKSTIAKAVAERFGFIYVDTGAIYRTVGLAAARAGVDPEDPAAVTALLPSLDIALSHGEDGLQHMHLNGEDVSAKIRTPAISRYASRVSAIPAVRAFLMDMQRDMARRTSVIMDGRDIGTVVLPDASLKIFLTASPEARGRRRFAELKEKGQDISLEEVLRDMAERDKNDSMRAAAPLRAAEDAVLVDTSELTLAESIDAVAELVQRRLGA